MRSYKKIGLSHEMGLIDTPLLCQVFSGTIKARVLKLCIYKKYKNNELYGGIENHSSILSFICPFFCMFRVNLCHSASFFTVLPSLFGHTLLRPVPPFCRIWPQGYKTFFMLNSAEHEI